MQRLAAVSDIRLSVRALARSNAENSGCARDRDERRAVGIGGQLVT
jgi:hypothetical protein